EERADRDAADSVDVAAVRPRAGHHRQIAGQRRQLAERTRGVDRVETPGELVHVEPTVAGAVAKKLRDPLAISGRRAHVGGLAPPNLKSGGARPLPRAMPAHYAPPDRPVWTIEYTGP